MNSLYYILSLIPIAGGIFLFCMNVTSRLSRIETDVKWIKKVINDRLFFDLDTKS